MKVLAINSSRRKGNTYRILLQIKNILGQNDIQLDIINLHDYKVKSCVGCENCLINDKCNLQDDINLIADKIIAYDGIILSSPVYLRSISGILKVFVDRTCSWYHRPVLYGKPILVVSTTKGSGLKYTLKYLEDIGIQWGMLPSGLIGRSIININKPVSYKECKKFIKNLKIAREKHRPQLRLIINFNIQKVLSTQLAGLDLQYWAKMNWNNQDYFYKCKINIVKRVIGRSVFTLLNMVMKKNKI